MGAFVSSPNKAHRASTSHGGPKALRKKSSVDKPAKDAPSQPLLPPVHDKASPAATAGRGDIAKLPPPQKDYRSNGHAAPHSADSHVTAPTTTTTTTAGHSDVQRHESTFSYGYSSYLEHLAQEETRTSEAVTTGHTFDNFHFPPLPSGQKSSSGDYNYASGTLVNAPAAVAAAAPSGPTQNAGQASASATQGNAAGPPSALIETGHTENDGRPSMQSAAPLTNFDTYTSVFRETLLAPVNAEADSIDLRSNNGSGGSSHDGARCEYSFFPESAQQRRSTALTASVVPLQATDTSVPRPRKSTRFSHAGLKSSRHSTTTSRRDTTSHTLMSSLFGRRSRVDRWSDTFMQSITNVTQSRSNSAEQHNAAAAESSMKTDSLSGSAAELHRTMHLGERQWQRVRQSVVQLHEGLREYFNADEQQDHVQCAESNTFSNTDSIVGPPATVLPQSRATNAGQDQPRQSYAWDGGISAVYETMSRSGSSDGSARRKSSASSSDDNSSSDGTEDGRGRRDFVRGSSLMPSTAKQHRRMLDGMGSISNWESGPGATALRSSRVMERGSYQRASAEDGETNTTTSDDDTEEEESESSASEEDNGMQREGEAAWGRGRRRSTRAQRVAPSGMTGPCLRQNGRPQAPVVPPPMMMMPGPAPFRRFAPPPLVQVSQPYGGAAMPFAHTPQPQPQQKPKPSTTTQPPANYGNAHPPQHAASVPPRVPNRVPQPQPDLRGPPLRRKVPINYERAFNFSLRDIPWVKSPSWEDMKVYSRQQRNKARA